MSFNHYAKLKRILADHDNWYIVRIDEPTSARSFKGELRVFDHYYRLYDKHNQPIKYGKFQQLDLLAKTLSTPIEELPVLDTYPSHENSS